MKYHTREEIKEIIASSKIKIAVTALRSVTAKDNLHLENEVIAISSRYQSLMSATNKGVISYTEQKITENQIIDSLYNILAKVPDYEIVEDRLIWKGSIQKQKQPKNKFSDKNLRILLFFFNSIKYYIFGIILLCVPLFYVFRDWSNLLTVSIIGLVFLFMVLLYDFFIEDVESITKSFGIFCISTLVVYLSLPLFREESIIFNLQSIEVKDVIIIFTSGFIGYLIIGIASFFSNKINIAINVIPVIILWAVFAILLFSQKNFLQGGNSLVDVSPFKELHFYNEFYTKNFKIEHLNILMSSIAVAILIYTTFVIKSLKLNHGQEKK